jgi:hypothetical protein
MRGRSWDPAGSKARELFVAQPPKAIAASAAPPDLSSVRLCIERTRPRARPSSRQYRSDARGYFRELSEILATSLYPALPGTARLNLIVGF